MKKIIGKKRKEAFPNQSPSDEFTQEEAERYFRGIGWLEDRSKK